MTKNNKQIRLPLHLKSEEDINEKIIKEKGNTKCIFYADDICRNGDKTRDCVNCARVEYHSLYSLNWDNQERLKKIIKHKELECEKAKQNAQDTYDLWQALIESFNILQGEKIKLEQECENNKIAHQMELDIFNQECLNLQEELKEALDQLKETNEDFLSIQYKLADNNKQLRQTLAEIKEIAYDSYNNGQTSYATFQCEKIINKINEVEE